MTAHPSHAQNVQGIIRAPLVKGLITLWLCPAHGQLHFCRSIIVPACPHRSQPRTIRGCPGLCFPLPAHLMRIIATRTMLLLPAGMFPNDWYEIVNVPAEQKYIISSHLFNRQGCLGDEFIFRYLVFFSFFLKFPLFVTGVLSWQYPFFSQAVFHWFPHKTVHK